MQPEVTMLPRGGGWGVTCGNLVTAGGWGSYLLVAVKFSQHQLAAASLPGPTL